MKKHDVVGVVSLGCSKNLVDTENMLGLLEQAGFAFTDDPAAADILVVNTCGFIESAKQESIDAILELAAYKTAGNCKTLVVTGCLSERYRGELKQELPEIDILLGVYEYEKLPALLHGAGGEQKAARRLTTPAHRAYLRIADGCSNRCTYCAIPLMRGPLHSVPMESLVDEAKRLADLGVSELTLVAQDTSGYGLDIYGRPRLLELMDALSNIDTLHWLRVLYTYPDTVTPALIKGIRGNGKICNYLDMPLQHIDDGILKRMNRRGLRAHIERVLDYIRTNAPDFMLRTTMMVGFPGETDAQFESMLAFLREYEFDRLGAFAFSPEDDTPAALMENQVPEDVKARRLDTLMRQQKEISMRRNEARVGSTVEALIESVSGDVALCRSYAEAPEVDGVIIVPARISHAPGQYITLRLTAAMEYDMEAEEIL